MWHAMVLLNRGNRGKVFKITAVWFMDGNFPYHGFNAEYGSARVDSQVWNIPNPLVWDGYKEDGRFQVDFAAMHLRLERYLVENRYLPDRR